MWVEWRAQPHFLSDSCANSSVAGGGGDSLSVPVLLLNGKLCEPSLSKCESALQVIMFKRTGHSVYFGGRCPDFSCDLPPSTRCARDLSNHRARIGK